MPPTSAKGQETSCEYPISVGYCWRPRRQVGDDPGRRNDLHEPGGAATFLQPVGCSRNTAHESLSTALRFSLVFVEFSSGLRVVCGDRRSLVSVTPLALKG